MLYSKQEPNHRRVDIPFIWMVLRRFRPLEGEENHDGIAALGAASREG